MAPALLGALATAPTLLSALFGRALRPAPARTATFDAPPAGTRWLVCPTTTCAHLTTRHTPTTAGAFECAECGHTTEEES